MPPLSLDFAAWTDRVHTTLGQYAEPLARAVCSRLVKPKIGQTLPDLIDKSAATLTNAPVIDRRIQELPEAAQSVLRLIGLSRQPIWKVGHLITLAAAAGFAEGFTPVQQLLEAGLVFPADHVEPEIVDFPAWYGRAGTLSGTIFVHPAVAARSRGLNAVSDDRTKAKAVQPAASADGLDWPLRLAAVWQKTRPLPIKLTQARLLFKRDLSRLQGDDVLNAPLVDVPQKVADAGVLAFEWAAAAGLFRQVDTEYHADTGPMGWSIGLWPLLSQLLAAFFQIETWDPLKGYAPTEGGLSPTPTAAIVLFDQLARAPKTWKTAAEMAQPLWENHPSWPGQLSRDEVKTHGAGWVEALLLSIACPLRLVEFHAGEPRQFRLSDFGRHLFCGEAEPAAPPPFPQTLMVQPNAEVIVYRQGLSPSLISDLSRFATWKQIGPACTLELNAEETYHGLESGMTLAGIKQTLDRHALRPVPNNVADLLRRWSDKRERITVYPSATLVEFTSPADLDLALSRGLVAVKLTDFIGLTADGRDPDFKSLRLIGNREYDARPVRCVTVSTDGLTLTVDAGQADILLEAEIVRIAEPVPSSIPGPRQFRMTPRTLRHAADHGFSLEELDQWFLTRTGGPLSPAGRLFVTGHTLPPPTTLTCRVVRLPNVEITDGLIQWPVSSGFIKDRLGPMAVVVDDADLPALRKVLKNLGIHLQELMPT